MNTLAMGISIAGFAMVMIAWVTYLATVPSGKVPRRPVGAIALQLSGVIVSTLAVVWSFQSTGSPSIAVIIPAVLALMMGSTFFFLLSQRKTPVGDLKVKVGDALLPFEAATSDGATLHTDSLTGKRTLLKFFRGGW